MILYRIRTTEGGWMIVITFTYILYYDDFFSPSVLLAILWCAYTHSVYIHMLRLCSVQVLMVFYLLQLIFGAKTWGLIQYNDKIDVTNRFVRLVGSCGIRAILLLFNVYFLLYCIFIILFSYLYYIVLFRTQHCLFIALFMSYRDRTQQKYFSNDSFTKD